MTGFNKQTIEDLLVTALEGGSNYWYFLPDLDNVEKLTWKDLPLAVKISNAVQFHNAKVDVHDIEDPAKKLGGISQDNFKRAYEILNLRCVDTLDNINNENYDANDADIWFQLVVMGEISFG